MLTPSSLATRKGWVAALTLSTILGVWCGDDAWLSKSSAQES